MNLLSTLRDIDYICDEEDLATIQSIAGLHEKKVVVRVGEAFVDVSHFQCLLNPCEHIWGDVRIGLQFNKMLNSFH